MGERIKICEIDKIKQFCEEMRKFESDVNVYKGSYIVDGKSMLGLLSLDLSTGVIISLLTDNKDEQDKFLEVIKKYKEV